MKYLILACIMILSGGCVPEKDVKRTRGCKDNGGIRYVNNVFPLVHVVCKNG